VDVHEMMALDYKNPTLRKILYYLYKTCPNKIIAHSAKISNALSEFSNKNEIIFVPLFHYHVDLDYDIKNLGEDVINVFENDSTYFLFFGNIRPSKGVHHLLAATELLKDDRIKIIIAGQDIFNKIQEYREAHVINENVISILRLINDDEMKYLFKKSHATLLPYESISQSAVLETAVNFKIPLITSDIDYFKTILSDFPSFGKRTDTTDPKVFVDSLIRFAQVDIKEQFYNKTDMEKYYESDKFDAFIKELKSL
jgi:glycosyltransferase involved in cell wall biosynthesis